MPEIKKKQEPHLSSHLRSSARDCETSADPRPVSGNFLLKIDVTIPARISSISPLVSAVLILVRQQGGGVKEMEIETALREALSNAVRHGCSEDPSKAVQCSVVFEENRSVLIVVKDPGQGFNPAKIPDPTKGKQVYASHGRGIYLIHQMMDEVSFRRGGAEIRMRSRF